MATLASIPPAAADQDWRPPAFCRMSWANQALRDAWEPRLAAARDALEDLALIAVAETGQGRRLYARPDSRDRLCALAEQRGIALNLAPATAGAHDVAAGRAARLALDAGTLGGSMASDDDAAVDPIWRLAAATPGAAVLDDGMRVAGDWASNPLLAAVGLAAVAPWPESFDDPAAVAAGVELRLLAEQHGYGAAIDDLREILSWPVAWTSLHGVAEVKTPVFRYVRDAPPLARRQVVHRAGTAMPDNAPRGIGFPFVARVRARSVE